MSDHLTKADAHLLNIPRPKKQKKEISSSTSLAFTSQLSSLIASQSSSAEPTRGRARPSGKADIFASHNKGAKRRAARDLENDSDSTVFKHRNLGEVDESTMHRSKRKMEEKARLYSAMKKGDVIAGENESAGLIDFDRKWAEKAARGADNELEVLSSSEDEWADEGSNEIVEYMDEFGRARIGTKAEVARMERKKRNQLLGAEELDRMSARPVAPSNVIYGDVVQTAAFNPDEEITNKMEDIARKRDRSMTPPDATHYDANKEIRSKGVGFFSFSKDEGTRKKEMEALEKERLETEKIRKEREDKKEARKKEIEQRRKDISEKRAKRQADSFLEGLGSNLVGE